MQSMMQDDTPEQKQILCELLRVHPGPIINDWSGEEMTVDEAVRYITEYHIGICTGKDDVEEEWLEPRPHGTPSPTVSEVMMNDLDVRSLLKMYPHVVFDPHVPEPDDNK